MSLARTSAQGFSACVSGARGRLITFEGIDGAGKSTHLRWFADQLRARGLMVLETREPGGVALAERLRELMLNEPMNPRTELLLAFAARNEHLQAMILPALAQGHWVVCDRFTDSTYAYQGGGRGVEWSDVAGVEAIVQRGLQPDRTFFFDVEPRVAAERRAAARAADRFEAEDLAFFERVREGYLRRMRECPDRIVRVDGGGGLDAVRALLAGYSDALLANRSV